MPENEKPVLWPGWETVRLIGRGSFGAVYEIKREVFGHLEKAAVKRITIPQNNSDIEELYDSGFDEQSVTDTFRSHMQNIVNEYSLMREMNGAANVVNCDDFRCVQHDDGIGWDIYIKMELLTPLTKDLPVKPDDATVVLIAKDMCRALVLCRRYGIIHRDIKPQNIFVSRNGDYKLGDFGIAKTVEKTSGGTKIGTYKYMAPEVFNNKPYNLTADIYSLGLVLHWMLNERRSPFMPLPPAPASAAGEEEARARRFRGEPLPPPAHGGEELKRIVLKACAFDPAERYQSADEMLLELERLGAPGAAFPAAPEDEATVGAAPGDRASAHSGAEEDDATVSGVSTAKKSAAPLSGEPSRVPPQSANARTPAYARQNAYPQQPSYTPPRQPQAPRQQSYAPQQTPYAQQPRAAYQSGYAPPRQTPASPAKPEGRPAPDAEKPGGKKKTGLIIGVSAGAIVLAAIIIVLALTLGGGTSAPASSGSAAAEAVKTYDVTLCMPESLMELTQRQIDRFNETNTAGVRFEPEFILADESVAAGMICDGTIERPDLFMFSNDQTGRLVAVGALSIPGSSSSSEVMAQDSAGSVSSATLGGVLYAYPMSADNGYFMYYDRSVIPDSDLGSLEEIIADCKTSGKEIHFELSSGWYNVSFFFGTGCVSEWESDAQGNAVSVYDTFNSAGGRAAAKGIHALANSGVWVDSSSCTEGFSSRRAAVVVSGIWDYDAARAYLGDDLGVAELPSFTVDGRSCHLGSFSGCKLIGVGPQSDDEREAALHLLAAYLSGEECQRERYLEANYVPSNLAAQREAADDPALQALFAQDAYAVTMRAIPGDWWELARTLATRSIYASSEAELSAALAEYESGVWAILGGSGADSIVIRFFDSERQELTIAAGEKIILNAYVLPESVEAPVSWSCSDTEGKYLKLELDESDSRQVTIECVSPSGSYVTLYAALPDGMTAECRIYFKR